MRKVVICDIDGTVADLTHRLHYVKDGNHDWDSFHTAANLDTPRQEIIDFVCGLQELDYEIYFVSGRPEKSRALTEEWLQLQNLAIWRAVYMRKDDDHRPDEVIKKEILDEKFDKSEIFMVIDDRPKVVEMWKNEGLNVLDVGPGPNNPF